MSHHSYTYMSSKLTPNNKWFKWYKKIQQCSHWHVIPYGEIHRYGMCIHVLFQCHYITNSCQLTYNGKFSGDKTVAGRSFTNFWVDYLQILQLKRLWITMLICGHWCKVGVGSSRSSLTVVMIGEIIFFEIKANVIESKPHGSRKYIASFTMK